MTRGSILAVVTEGSLTCPPWRSHLEVDLQSETRPRLAVAQMHRVRGYIFDEARVYEHSSVVWSVTSAAVHLQRYSCVSVYPCICDISVYLHVKVECWKRAAHAGAFRVPLALPATRPSGRMWTAGGVSPQTIGWRGAVEGGSQAPGGSCTAYRGAECVVLRVLRPLDTLTPRSSTRPQSGSLTAHLDGGLFDRPPPEGFPVVLGQPPLFP